MTQDKLKLITLKELWEMEFIPRSFVINPWMRQGESAMLFGGPGVGKSMFVLTLALLVAGGGEFMDWQNRNPRRVLLIDGEMALDDINARSMGLWWGIERFNADLAGGNLTILSRQSQTPGCTFPDISTEVGREQIIEYAEGFDLVIFDNLSTLALDLGDENAAAEFNDIIRVLMTLKQARIATILVHHTNKRGANYRGSSKLATTFECILGMKFMEHPPADWHGTKFMLEWHKYRGQREDNITNSDVRFYQNDAGQIYWEARLSVMEEAAQLVELIKTGEFSTQAELAKAMNVSTGKLSNLKHKAIDHKLISKDEWQECLVSRDF